MAGNWSSILMKIHRKKSYLDEEENSRERLPKGFGAAVEESGGRTSGAI